MLSCIHAMLSLLGLTGEPGPPGEKGERGEAGQKGAVGIIGLPGKWLLTTVYHHECLSANITLHVSLSPDRSSRFKRKSGRNRSTRYIIHPIENIKTCVYFFSDGFLSASISLYSRF